MKSLRKILLPVFALAITACSTTTAVANPRCATRAEADALNMRVLQTDLMVAGLSCQMHAEYASFVKYHKDNLKHHGGVMRDYFQRISASPREMDKFVTSLANESSTQSLNMKAAQFCNQAKLLFGEVNSISHDALLEKLARTPDITARTTVPLCSQSARR
jgi:hypothetical protein